MTRQDLVNKSIDKLNTVKEALELIEILEYDECIAVLTGTKNLPSEMKRKIMVNNKEFTMPKMSIDTYTEYLELAEIVDAKQRYSKQDIEAMGLFICKAYGDQFTVEELKNPETGLDAAGLILEFQFIDMGIADDLTKRIEKIEKNFQSGK